MDEDHLYRTGFQQTQRRVRRQIWNTRNHNLRRVLREFPTDEPLRDQCALWMHALVGKHFFPDANHRTAVATLRTLLKENGIVYADWSLQRLRDARTESHEVRREIDRLHQIEDIHMGTLYRRDELYRVWFEFFEDELQPLTGGSE